MLRNGLIAAVTAVLLAAGALLPAQTAPAPTGVTVLGVDLHDGMMLERGGIYYLYGTRYGCGFAWGVPGTPWCGFGVATASSPAGPWSPISPLFSPSDVAPGYGLTWQQICGGSGWGCFNPRMILRAGWGPDDGVPILWFNAPDDYNRSGANAYWAMGCNSLMGPCGITAGAPNGSTTKPSAYQCYGNGDFSIVADPPRAPMMLCTMPDQTLSSERLSYWGSSMVGGGHASLAGLTATEAPGAYRDGSGAWVMTYNEPNCGYCGGAPTSYATAPTVDGVWSTPANPNPAWGAKPIGRRGISATSCGGQGRTVVTLQGQPYQFIDLWLGTANETGAGIRLEPLVYDPTPTPLGRPWAPFQAWTCR
jgi:hypothetical protein